MRVIVSPYSVEWPVSFEAIKVDLATALESIPYISIEHVGSTSVPGLPAKPIIDISIVIPRASLASTITALTQRAGYIYMGEWGVRDRFAFRKPLAENHPARNLYVCIEGCPALLNHLAVRDVCRREARVRQEYARVKLELAQSEWGDVEEYCDAKDEVLTWVLKQAGLSDEQLLEIKRTNMDITES